MPRHTHTSGPLTVHQSTGRHVYKQQRETNIKDSRDTGNEKGHLNHMGANDLQRITIINEPDAGNFDLDFTVDTAVILFNETAAAFQAKLEALASIGVGNVVVTGEDGGPWEIEFVNTMAYTEQPLMVVSANALTGVELAYEVAVEHPRPGRAGQVSPVVMTGDLTGGLTELVTTLDSDEAPAPVPTRLILDGGDPVSVPEPPPGAEENTRKFHRGHVFSGRIPFEL